MRNRKAVLLWALVTAYAVAVFVASSMPAPTPEVGPVLISDKALHALEYGVFALLLAIAISTVRHPRVRTRAALVAFAVAALYGLSDELHQTLVPGRVGDPLDLAWDLLGSGIAAAGFHIVQSRRARTRAVSDTSHR